MQQKNESSAVEFGFAPARMMAPFASPGLRSVERAVLLVLVAGLTGLSTVRAQEAYPTVPGAPVRPTAWASAISDAERLLSQDPETAKRRFAEVLESHPFTEGARAAVSGIANAYTMQRDYSGMTRFLETVINQDKDPSVAQEARRVYSTMASRVDQAHMNAYQTYAQAQSEYDSISWFNIFRLFDKLDLRSKVKQMKEDLNYITDVKLSFNPVYLLPATEPTAPSTNVDPAILEGAGTEVTHLPPLEFPELPSSILDKPDLLPPDFSEEGASIGTSDESGTDGGLASETGISSGETTDSVNEEGGAATESVEAAAAASPDETLTPADEVMAQIDAKLEAVRTLREELNQILQLVPEDKREEARGLIVSGGGYGLLPVLEADSDVQEADAAASDTLIESGEGAGAGVDFPESENEGDSETSAQGATDSTDAVEQISEDVEFDDDTAAAPIGTDTIPVVLADGDGETASGDSGSSVMASDTLASDVEEVATEATNVAADPDALKEQMMGSYRNLLEAMRTSQRERAAELQGQYVRELKAYREAVFGRMNPAVTAGTSATDESPSSPESEPAPTGMGDGSGADTAAAETVSEDGTSTAASETSVSETRTLGDLTPTNSNIAQPSVTTGGPIRINTQVDSTGRPVTDQTNYSIFSSFLRD